MASGLRLWMEGRTNVYFLVCFAIPLGRQDLPGVQSAPYPTPPHSILSTTRAPFTPSLLCISWHCSLPTALLSPGTPLPMSRIQSQPSAQAQAPPSPRIRQLPPIPLSKFPLTHPSRKGRASQAVVYHLTWVVLSLQTDENELRSCNILVPHKYKTIDWLK